MEASSFGDIVCEAGEATQQHEPCVTCVSLYSAGIVATEQTPATVRHNENENRFEADVDGLQAVADYVRRDDEIIFTHTQVPNEIEGQGIGNSLAEAALDYARAEGLRVVPRCAFIAAYIKRHEKYQDLVDDAV